MEENNKKSLDKKRIERYVEKLEHLKKIMKEFHKWIKDIDDKLFLASDLKEQFGIYHGFQIMVEIITDIIAMMVKDVKIKPKDDYTNINCLKEQHLISEELSSGLRKLNGLKNVLVHDYNGIDDLLAFKSINEGYPYIKEFYEVIRDWLKKHS
ncbi:MAG: type VII toxin-antitoxin system HepT family RNase toxin [Promethearchaeota archaeon]